MNFPECLRQRMAHPTNKSTIFNFSCGLGVMFVQSEKFVKEHGERVATSRFKGRNGRKRIQRLAMKESRTFAALLPKLLSGELRVPLDVIAK
jgi:hypothetical protein